MQAYTHSAASTADSQTGVVASINLTNQSDFSNGNILVAYIAFTGGTGVTVTPPAGWTLRLRQDNGTGVGIAIYTKTAASEGASWRFDFSPTSSCVVSYGIIANGNATDPFSSISGLTNASGTSHSFPEYYFGSYASIAILATVLSDNVTTTPPTDYTEAVDHGEAVAPKCALTVETRVHNKNSGAMAQQTAVSSGAAVSAAIAAVVEGNLGIIERFISLSAPDAVTIHVRVQ